MARSRRQLLIPHEPDECQPVPRPARWWRYGAVAAGVGLAAARLSSGALAAAPVDDGQHLGYDPGHDGASWILASAVFAPDDHGKGKSDDKGKGEEKAKAPQ